MNKLLAALIAGAIAVSATLAFAQTTPQTADEKAKAKAEKEAKFKATEQTLQKESSTSAAQNVGGSTAKTTTASDPGKLGKATKEQKAAYEKSLEKESKGGGGQ